MWEIFSYKEWVRENEESRRIISNYDIQAASFHQNRLQPWQQAKQLENQGKSFFPNNYGKVFLFHFPLMMLAAEIEQRQFLFFILFWEIPTLCCCLNIWVGISTHTHTDTLRHNDDRLVLSINVLKRNELETFVFKAGMKLIINNFFNRISKLINSTYLGCFHCFQYIYIHFDAFSFGKRLPDYSWFQTMINLCGLPLFRL